MLLYSQMQFHTQQRTGVVKYPTLRCTPQGGSHPMYRLNLYLGSQRSRHQHDCLKFAKVLIVYLV